MVLIWAVTESPMQSSAKPTKASPKMSFKAAATGASEALAFISSHVCFPGSGLHLQRIFIQWAVLIVLYCVFACHAHLWAHSGSAETHLPMWLANIRMAPPLDSRSIVGMVARILYTHGAAEYSMKSSTSMGKSERAIRCFASILRNTYFHTLCHRQSACQRAGR